MTVREAPAEETSKDAAERGAEGHLDRRGVPAPLVQHLAAAAKIYETGAQLAPLAATDRFPWGAEATAADRALVGAVAEAPQLEMALALRTEAAGRLSDMLRGLRLYQASAARRTLEDPPVLWRAGSARLLDFGQLAGEAIGRPGGRPVLIAPSLINSSHILDLDEGEGGSLLRWLAEQGLRPLLLDWGVPGPEEAAFGLGDYIERRLLPAFDAAREATGARVAAVGYCMGGALTVALANRRPDDVSHVALIGAPWDFAEMTPMRAALASLGVTGERAALSAAIDGVVSTFGAVPVSALQAVFAQLDPGLAARKFRRFASLDQDSAEARRFVLIEDWLNAGPPLSGAVAREALIDWHLDNATANGAWRVNAAPVDPGAVAAPALVAAAVKDRITPPAATEALARQIPDARVIRPEAGHVGMIVGRDAMRQLWRPLADFLLS